MATERHTSSCACCNCRASCRRCDHAVAGKQRKQAQRPPKGSSRPKVQRATVPTEKNPGLLINVPQCDVDLARSFFFFHYFSLGRTTGPSRHAFDLLPTILVKERNDSALALCFNVASIRMWHLWRNRSSSERHRVVSPHLVRALQRLQKAIDDPVESKAPGTVLAAFVLQFDESNSAISDGHKPVWVHHHGAMSLAKHQLTGSCKGPIAATLLHNVFQVEVSYALRQKTVVPQDLVRRIMRSGILQNDVIARLDMIGVDIASCQHRFTVFSTNELHGPSYSKIHEEAESIRQRLVAWENTVPESWRPSHIDEVRKTDPPIITYSGGCDVYPTVQIADLWNTWRCRHLVLLNILFRTLPSPVTPLLHTSRNIWASQKLVNEETRKAGEHTTRYMKIVQDIVDDICDTYPFFLGNVSRRVDYTDLSSHGEYPSCHDLGPDSSTEGLMSRELHVRHVMTQGPWFAVTILTYLITLMSSSDGKLGAALRPGQLDWLFQQFRRILMLWHVDLGDWSSIDYIRERMRYTTSI